MIGAVPYLVKNGENGLIYQDGRAEQLFAAAERLVRDRTLCRELGRAAYLTITRCWNAENAAGRLLDLIAGITGLSCGEGDGAKAGQDVAEGALRAVEKSRFFPCAPAEVLSERFRG